jgi:hypothetical protein
MPRSVSLLAALLCALTAVPARAHGPNQPPHQLYQIGDFKLESAEARSSSESQRSGRSVLGCEPGPGSAAFAPPRDSPSMSAAMSG